MVSYRDSRPLAASGLWEPSLYKCYVAISSDPPHVPTENLTGTYRRVFHVPYMWEESQLRLRFDGVDSAFLVWVNGIEEGYSQGSRNPAEIDITALVRRDAENEVWVRVYQWCDGSYIEDQDQWWLSGIFCTLHWLAFPAVAQIDDFFAPTELDDDYKHANLRLELGRDWLPWLQRMASRPMFDFALEPVVGVDVVV